MSDTDLIADSYASLDALRSAHNELLQSLPDEETELPEDVRRASDARISDFIRRAVDSGTQLDSPADRKIAQGLIDYWVASAYAASRERYFSRSLPDRTELVLKPFDSAKVTEAALQADQFIDSLDVKDQDLARRIVMHLVRLTGAGETCRVEPQDRNKLLSLGNVKDTDLIVKKLIGSGVLRATPATDDDRVELSYEALTRQWPRLRKWINERLVFRGSVVAWEQGNKSAFDLSFNRALLRQTDAYGDLNKDELEFKQKSERFVRRSTRALWLLAALIVLPAVSLQTYDIFHDQYIVASFRDKIWIVKKLGSSSQQKFDAIMWLADHQSKIPFPSFDFSKATLDDLNLSEISLWAPNFANATLTGVNLDKSTLLGARFSSSTITNSKTNPLGSFEYSKLTQSRFDGAALAMLDFKHAKLDNASFDRARFCNLDFSGADLRAASFQAVIFEPGYPVPIFKDTAWWLATGWSLEKIDKLNEFSYADLAKKDEGFNNAMKEHETNIVNSGDNTLDRARALNGKAWTLAIYGVQLETAGKVAEDAIAIADLLNDKVRAANFRDTLGYIRLQQGTIADAADTLKAAVSGSDDPEILFRYAVALNAVGNTPEAIEKLTNSVSTEKGNYSPSHELHLLRDYINGDFKTTLAKLLDKRPLPPGVPDPPLCPSAERSG
jgi:uncharacterized protein YjbI with pentapeptide repeats